MPTDEEGLCCVKAIVFAIAHLEKDKTAINAMKRQDRPSLINRERQLHEDTGVPFGPCTSREITKFEEFLKIQIAVSSSKNRNRVRLQFFNLYAFIHVIYILRGLVYDFFLVG